MLYPSCKAGRARRLPPGAGLTSNVVYVDPQTYVTPTRMYLLEGQMLDVLHKYSSKRWHKAPGQSDWKRSLAFARAYMPPGMLDRPAAPTVLTTRISFSCRTSTKHQLLRSCRTSTKHQLVQLLTAVETGRLGPPSSSVAFVIHYPSLTPPTK